MRRRYRAALARSDDSSLIREAQRNSPAAVEALVRRHWDSAHRTAFLIVHDAGVAEDIVQEAIVAAVRAIDSFDRRRPFAPWLHRIVVNRALDWLRLRQRRPEVELRTAHHDGRGAGQPDWGEGGLSAELLGALAALDSQKAGAQAFPLRML